MDAKDNTMAKVETERYFGKKGIIIMIRDGNKMVSAIFKDKKNADKFNRNNPSDVKKLLQLAKKTKYPKAIDESVNENFPNMKKWWKEDKKEVMSFIYYLQGQLPPNNKDKYKKAWVSIAKQLQKKTPAPNNIYKKIVGESVNEGSKEALGIAKLTGARGVAIDDFIKKHNIDAKKLFNYVKKGNLQDRLGFITALVGKPNNKFFKMVVGRFAESVNEGKKRYYQKDGIGKAKYTISYHDGKKKHKDGSDFFDIQIFRNKKDLAKFVNTLHKGGYVYGFNESVNEGSMDWEKHFKGYNEKELKVISKFIWMNPQGIDGVIKMSKKKDFKPFIQKAAKKGLGESVNEARLDFFKFADLMISIRKYKKGTNKKDITKDVHDYFGVSGDLSKSNVVKLSNHIYKKLNEESINEILVIVDKFDKRKQDYGKVYFSDGGNRPSDGNLKKAQKELEKLSKKHKGLTLISVGRDSKMYDVNESVNEAFLVAYGKGPKPMKPAFAAYADKKMAQKFMADMKKDGYKVMMTQKKIRGIDENKSEISKIYKQAGKKEIKFYDILSNLEKKLGKNKYRAFLVKSLKDFKINGNHYDYRTNAAAEEKLFQLAK